MAYVKERCAEVSPRGVKVVRDPPPPHRLADVIWAQDIVHPFDAYVLGGMLANPSLRNAFFGPSPCPRVAIALISMDFT